MLDKSMVVVNRVRVFVMMDTVVVCNSYVVYESVCREVCINMVGRNYVCRAGRQVNPSMAEMLFGGSSDVYKQLFHNMTKVSEMPL